MTLNLGFRFCGQLSLVKLATHYAEPKGIGHEMLRYLDSGSNTV